MSNSRSLYIIALIALAVVYIKGLFIDVMDVDAAQYASIAREMMEHGDYLQVKHLGNDYLDKPPLLFWLSALSFQLFGISNFAYKLPSFLFTLLGIFSTYKLALLFYKKEVAQTSALIFATCQALFLITNDVRTDTTLVSAIVFAVWQLAAYLKEGKWLLLIGGSLGIGFAMLAKGPIGLMVPVLGFGTHWILTKQNSNFFRWQWLVLIVIVGLMLSPMLYGLYQQHGSYGPYFFFWEQSFGRLTGQNEFINTQTNPQGKDPSYFLHTILWTFLPWALLFYAGLFQKIKAVFQKKETEYLTLGAFILPLIALSFSGYKLPHYIYVTYPFIAIIAGKYFHQSIANAEGSSFSILYILQTFICILLWVMTISICTYIFPTPSPLLWLGMVLLLGMTFYCLIQPNRKIKLLLPSIFSIIGFNLLLNVVLFPELMQYQSFSKAGQYIQSNELDGMPLYLYKIHAHSFDFYHGFDRTVTYSLDEVLESGKKQTTLVFMNTEGLSEIKNSGVTFEQVNVFPHYKVTLLQWQFLNPATREATLQQHYLLKIFVNE